MHDKLEPAEFKTSTSAEFLKAQSVDIFFRKGAKQEGFIGIDFSQNSRGVVIMLAPVDEAVQKLIPQSVRQRILYLFYYPLLAVRLRKRQTYIIMRSNRYRSNIAQDVYHSVCSCHSCVRSWVPLKHKLHLRLFRACGDLEFVAMEILGPLTKTIEKINTFPASPTDALSLQEQSV